eukprot:gene3134-3412_t
MAWRLGLLAFFGVRPKVSKNDGPPASSQTGNNYWRPEEELSKSTAALAMCKRTHIDQKALYVKYEMRNSSYAVRLVQKLGSLGFLPKRTTEYATFHFFFERKEDYNQVLKGWPRKKVGDLLACFTGRNRPRYVFQKIRVVNGNWYHRVFLIRQASRNHHKTPFRTAGAVVSLVTAISQPDWRNSWEDWAVALPRMLVGQIN